MPYESANKLPIAQIFVLNQTTNNITPHLHFTLSRLSHDGRLSFCSGGSRSRGIFSESVVFIKINSSVYKNQHSLRPPQSNSTQTRTSIISPKTRSRLYASIQCHSTQTRDNPCRHIGLQQFLASIVYTHRSTLYIQNNTYTYISISTYIFY